MTAGLPSRLKALRRALSLSQEEFAKLYGIPLPSLVGYEVGSRKPGAGALAAIARTGVNLTWLLTGEGEMWPAKPQETAPSAALGRYGRRLEKIAALLEQLPEERAEALIADYLARAQDTAEALALRQELAALRDALKRSA